MKVIAYVHAYVPDHNGGAETTLHELLRYMVSEGHEAKVILKESPYLRYKEYEIEGVRVIQSRDKTDIVRHLPWGDIILTHLECSPRAAILAKKFKIPVGHIVHNNLDLTKRYIAHGADLVVFNTEWIREDFKETCHKIPQLVVRPPIFGDRYKVDKGRKITLVNLFESKGQDIFYALASRCMDLNFLAVEGGYGEQVFRRDLPNVEFIKNDFDVRHAYSQSKVILMPSKYESYGRVACEALASGIPSIVSDTPGLREALGDAGTYVTRHDPLTDADVDAWEKALRSLLTPRRYGAMSKVALARSEALHTMAVKELQTFKQYLEEVVRINKRRG